MAPLTSAHKRAATTLQWRQTLRPEFPADCVVVSTRKVYSRISQAQVFVFALTVASSGLQLEVVLRKGQRLLDRGPYTGAWTEAALAPRAAAAHRATPPSPAVTGRKRVTKQTVDIELSGDNTLPALDA